jgi:hypothetical protein
MNENCITVSSRMAKWTNIKPSGKSVHYQLEKTKTAVAVDSPYIRQWEIITSQFTEVSNKE